MTDHKPMVKLAGLFERTSKNNNRYFSGLLGGARVLIFENREHNPEDPKSPTHHLFVQEIDHKPAEAAKPPATSQTSSGSNAKQARDFRRNGDGSENEAWLFDASGRQRRNPNFRRSATTPPPSDDAPF